MAPTSSTMARDRFGSSARVLAYRARERGSAQLARSSRVHRLGDAALLRRSAKTTATGGNGRTAGFKASPPPPRREPCRGGREAVCFSYRTDYFVFSDLGSLWFLDALLFRVEMSSSPAAGVRTLPSRMISFAERSRP